MLSNVHLTSQQIIGMRGFLFSAPNLVAILKTSVAQVAVANKDKMESSYVNCCLSTINHHSLFAKPLLQTAIVQSLLSNCY